MPIGMCSTNVYRPTQTIHSHLDVVVGSASGWDASKAGLTLCDFFNSLLRLLLVTLYEHDPHVKL